MNWITDRPPTQADGDEDGEVILRRLPEGDVGAGAHWSYVAAGAPWRHTLIWQPPSPAADPRYSQGMSERPPLGARPRWLVLEERADDLRRAIDRYSEQALLVPDEWLTELAEINQLLPMLSRDRHPKPKSALALGQTWRRRDGKLVTITSFEGYPFWAHGVWYSPDGRHANLVACPHLELVELVSQPTKL